MSRENVERIRAAFENFLANKSDFGAELLAPDVEWNATEAGILDISRTYLSAWDEYRVKAEEYRELDGERVLALAHFSALGRTSGLEVRQFTTTKGGANLFNLRGGQVTRLVVYWDRARAFADLGLAE